MKRTFDENEEAHFMHKLFDALTQRIFALDRWQRFIDLLRCTTSRVVNKVAKIILFLQLNFSMYVCHCEDLLQLRVVIQTAVSSNLFTGPTDASLKIR